MWSKEVNDDECEGGFELTPITLKKLCRELKLYSSCPELNEVLHLHQKGIVKLKNLDEYTGLRTIYLECNETGRPSVMLCERKNLKENQKQKQQAISKIEGLDQLVNIQCLYLNENLVENISGLNKLKELETLDLANNQIKKIQGLNGCAKLRQLNLSGNRIRSLEDTIHLKDCESIQSLDLSNNQIDDELALEVIRSLHLRLLRLIGNPIVSKTRHYRKKTITSIQELHYLDDSPVFEKDRRLAEAWKAGGLLAEQTMREIIRKEEADIREKHLKAFDELVQNAKARAEDEAMQGKKTCDVKDNMMTMTIESDSAQQESIKNDIKLPTLLDLMEEDGTMRLQSQVLDPLKWDAITFDPHSHDVSSLRKLRKCNQSIEEIQSNGHGEITDSINMEIEMSFPNSNFPDVSPSYASSSVLDNIVYQSKERVDGAEFIVADDKISKVHSELASCNVQYDNKFLCDRCPDLDKGELRTIDSIDDSKKSNVIQVAHQHHKLLENILTY